MSLAQVPVPCLPFRLRALPVHDFSCGLWGASASEVVATTSQR